MDKPHKDFSLIRAGAILASCYFASGNLYRMSQFKKPGYCIHIPTDYTVPHIHPFQFHLNMPRIITVEPRLSKLIGGKIDWINEVEFPCINILYTELYSITLIKHTLVDKYSRNGQFAVQIIESSGNRCSNN